MKPSPVQLLQLFFQKLSVEVDSRHLPSELRNPLTEPFLFDGVTLRTTIGINEPEQPSPDENVFQLSFELVVDNEGKVDKPDQRYSPYKLDVQVVAWVRLHRNAEALGPLRDLALVNGAALIWSTIREQVAMTTGRMPYGSVQLPTVHFQDLRSDAKRPAARKTSAKKLESAKAPQD